MSHLIAKVSKESLRARLGTMWMRWLLLHAFHPIKEMYVFLTIDMWYLTFMPYGLGNMNDILFISYLWEMRNFDALWIYKRCAWTFWKVSYLSANRSLKALSGLLCLIPWACGLLDHEQWMMHWCGDIYYSMGQVDHSSTFWFDLTTMI